MDLQMLIPISLFAAIAYSIKAVVDARVRSKLVQANVSQDLVRSIVESEEAHRRNASLRWGIVLVALAVGFGLIDTIGWEQVTAGGIALLLGATGLGNLAYYFVARRKGA